MDRNRVLTEQVLLIGCIDSEIVSVALSGQTQKNEASRSHFFRALIQSLSLCF
jgi:hypothetical protein